MKNRRIRYRHLPCQVCKRVKGSEPLCQLTLGYVRGGDRRLRGLPQWIFPPTKSRLRLCSYVVCIVVLSSIPRRRLYICTNKNVN